MKGISDSQGPEKWVMLLQIPFEPGQKTPREHSFHSKAGFKAMVVQKRLAPFPPVPFLINLSSIKKTNSKKWEKKKYQYVSVTLIERGKGDVGKQFHRFGQQDSIWLWNQLYLHLNKCARQKEWKFSTSSWQQAELAEKPLIVWFVWWLLLLNINCIQKKNQPNDFALQGLTHWSLNPNSLLYTVLFATSKTRHHFCVCWHSALCSSFTTRSRFRTLPGPSSY